jgi:hypothetical protein
VSCGARGATAIPPAAPGRDRDPPAAPPCRAIPRTATPYPLPYRSLIVSESMTFGRFPAITQRRVHTGTGYRAGGCVCTHRTLHATLRAHGRKDAAVGCMKFMYTHRAGLRITHQRNRVKTQVGVRSSASAAAVGCAVRSAVESQRDVGCRTSHLSVAPVESQLSRKHQTTPGQATIKAPTYNKQQSSLGPGALNPPRPAP